MPVINHVRCPRGDDRRIPASQSRNRDSSRDSERGLQFPQQRLDVGGGVVTVNGNP